jgi:putative transposase
MPRRPRIHLAGVPLHSVQRGHNRDACFLGEDDYISPGRRYVRYINKTYHRTGTLWDSRYTSSLVQEDTY